MIKNQQSCEILINSITNVKQTINKQQMLGQNHFQCFSCSKEFLLSKDQKRPQKSSFPITNCTTDIITIEKHILCIQCNIVFQNVQNMVNKFKLKAFDSQFKLEKMIDSTFIKMSQIETNFTKKQIKMEDIKDISQQSNNESKSVLKNLLLPPTIYNLLIQQTIESQNLDHIHILPKPVQYLLYLSTNINIRPQQRRVRIKKLIQQLSYFYCLDLKELRYLTFLIQTLSCFMDQHCLFRILDKLLRALVKNQVGLNVFLTSKNQKSSISKDSQDRNPIDRKSIQFRPDTFLQMLLTIVILTDFFRDQKLIRNIKQVVNLSLKNLQIIAQQIINNKSLTLLSKTYEQYLTKKIGESTSNIQKLTNKQWQQLFQVKRQKNSLNFILKTIKKEQQVNQEIIKQIQSKFKKEKDQYVNKIMKLNNRIDDLQRQLRQIKQQKSLIRSIDQEIKSNPQLKIGSIQKQQQQRMAPEGFKNAFIQNQAATDQLSHHLQSILCLTDIISLNKSLSAKKKNLPIELPKSIQQLSSLIISQINLLSGNLVILQQQNKKLREQANRVFSILLKKETQWLPLFHQKDQIIALYQKALLCLENGVILADQPLSSRITIILTKVKAVKEMVRQKQDQDNSMRDSVLSDIQQSRLSSLVPQKQAQPPKQVNKSGTKKVSSGKKKQNVSTQIKKKSKKQKQKQKQTQCSIY